MRRLLPFLVALVLLAGCTSAPAPERPRTEVADDEVQERSAETATTTATQGSSSTTKPAPPSTTPPPPPPPPKPSPAPNSTAEGPRVLDQKSFPGRMTVTYLGNNLLADDPTTFTVAFPPGYRSALVEMEWEAFAPTNEELSLMVHVKGGLDASAMVFEANGPAPLSGVLTPAVASPGEWDILGTVPLDGRTPLVVNQEFTIHVTFFDGPVPAGYTAVGSD